MGKAYKLPEGLTEAEILDIIKDRWYIIDQVKNQTPAVVAVAMNNLPTAFWLLHEQPEELCWEALKKEPRVIADIRNPTQAMEHYAEERLCELCTVSCLKRYRTADRRPARIERIKFFLEDCNGKRSVSTFPVKGSIYKRYQGLHINPDNGGWTREGKFMPSGVHHCDLVEISEDEWQTLIAKP